MSFMMYAIVQQTGRRIPVVRLLWEQVDPVRFWAPRHGSYETINLKHKIKLRI
jgi:hypothetical protein